MNYNYWKIGVWCVVLVPVVSLLWWLAFGTAYYSQLAMPMTVHLDRPAGAVPIKAVWLSSYYHRRPRFDYLLANLGKAEKWVAEHELWPAELVHGEPIDFRVPGDDSGSMLGVTLSYVQHKHLLVIAELVDGRWVGTVADIPDARTTQEMRVVLP